MARPAVLSAAGDRVTPVTVTRRIARYRSSEGLSLVMGWQVSGWQVSGWQVSSTVSGALIPNLVGAVSGGIRGAIYPDRFDGFDRRDPGNASHASDPRRLLIQPPG